MRIEQNNLGLRVVLSRRNLMALLTKLDLPASARTIYSDGVYVTAEENDAHYGGREPGLMHPDTEAKL